MEHILQFGINIDDEKIKQSIKEKAEKEVLNVITQDVKRALFEPYSTYGVYRDKFTYIPTNYLNDKIVDFLNENKDEILEMTANKLAEKLSKTKKAKETLDAVLKEI